MKLVVQIAAGIVLGCLTLLVGYVLLSSGRSAPDTTVASGSGCDDSTVKTNASAKLADWLNQNVGKGNAYNAHGTFVAEISTSISVGSLQGTQQCMSMVSLGLRHAGGGTLIAQQPTNIHFLLDDGNVIFDKGDLVSEAAQMADSLLVRDAMTADAPTAEN